MDTLDDRGVIFLSHRSSARILRLSGFVKTVHSKKRVAFNPVFGIMGQLYQEEEITHAKEAQDLARPADRLYFLGRHLPVHPLCR